MLEINGSHKYKNVNTIDRRDANLFLNTSTLDVHIHITTYKINKCM